MPKQAYTAQTMILKGTQRPVKEVSIDGRRIVLDNKHHQNFIKDPGLAKEIEARYGVGKGNGEISKDLVVVPVNRITEQAHNYSFTVPDSPLFSGSAWKKDK
jgi:hypothetical protein